MTILTKEVLVHINESNRTRLEEAARTKSSAQLHFKPSDFQAPQSEPEAAGFHIITLSASQLSRLNSALKHNSQDIVLNLPLSQIKQQGGSLASLIAPFLKLATKFGPQILGTAALGGVSGLSNALGNRLGHAGEGLEGGMFNLSIMKAAQDKILKDLPNQVTKNLASNLMTMRGDGIVQDTIQAVARPLTKGFNFTKGQINRIIDGIRNRSDFTLRLRPNQLDGPMEMPMSGSGYKGMNQTDKRTNITFSGAGLAEALSEHSEGQSGGMAFLIPLLGSLLAPMIGQAMGGSGTSKKSLTY